MELIERIGTYVGPVALLGLALLGPLYLSQARDIRRLRDWSVRVPDSAAAEAQAAALANIPPGVDRTVVPRPATAAGMGRAITPVEPIPAAERVPVPPARRVAADRPAAARVTAPRPAVRPEPWWRRALRPLWSPQGLIAAGCVLLVVGGIVYGANELLGDEEAPPGTGAEPTVVPEEVDVAVLNGTAVPGLAAKVSQEVEASGYGLGAVTDSETAFRQTQVMYASGHEAEAIAVAEDLGVESVRSMDPETSGLAGAADVVVVAGEDQASA